MFVVLLVDVFLRAYNLCERARVSEWERDDASFLKNPANVCVCVCLSAISTSSDNPAVTKQDWGITCICLLFLLITETWGKTYLLYWVNYLFQALRVEQSSAAGKTQTHRQTWHRHTRGKKERKEKGREKKKKRGRQCIKKVKKKGWKEEKWEEGEKERKERRKDKKKS